MQRTEKVALNNWAAFKTYQVAIRWHSQGFQSADSIHAINLLASGLFTVNNDVDWLKCTEQHVNNQSLTQVLQLYIQVSFNLKVIRLWYNMSTAGHGHVICMLDSRRITGENIVGHEVSLVIKHGLRVFCDVNAWVGCIDPIEHLYNHNLACIDPIHYIPNHKLACCQLDGLKVNARQPMHSLSQNTSNSYLITKVISWTIPVTWK